MVEEWTLETSDNNPPGIRSRPFGVAGAIFKRAISAPIARVIFRPHSAANTSARTIIFQARRLIRKTPLSECAAYFGRRMSALTGILIDNPVTARKLRRLLVCLPAMALALLSIRLAGHALPASTDTIAVLAEARTALAYMIPTHIEALVVMLCIISSNWAMTQRDAIRSSFGAVADNFRRSERRRFSRDASDPPMAALDAPGMACTESFQPSLSIGGRSLRVCDTGPSKLPISYAQSDIPTFPGEERAPRQRKREDIAGLSLRLQIEPQGNVAMQDARAQHFGPTFGGDANAGGASAS